MSCCGMSWVGPDRAHCCRRTNGCGQVFDDAALYDAHRSHGTCLDPLTVNLVRTRNGIWLRPLDHPELTPNTRTRSSRSATTSSTARALAQRRRRRP
jgi:hypothetical protein